MAEPGAAAPKKKKSARHKSAIVRTRRNARRAAINRMRLSRVRGFVVGVESAIASGDKKAAMAALRAAEPELARGAQKGVIRRQTAQRKLSRLNARVKAMAS
jgi:small subunit ribosomal protein S20